MEDMKRLRSKYLYDSHFKALADLLLYNVIIQSGYSVSDLEDAVKVASHKLKAERQNYCVRG